MARMPGTIWKPIPKSRTARRKGRGICLHVAVSEAASLHGFFSASTSDSHFYVRRDGTIEQYVDTDLVAYANAAGNSSLISVETQGGVTNANSEPWTAQQIDALARLCRWAADTDGFPLEAMLDSRPASRGVGYHRLGCKPWVVSGGELWSSAAGKICPGAGKIAQIPQIITLARNGSENFLMALSDGEQAELRDKLRAVHSTLLTTFDTHKNSGSQVADNTGHTLAIRAELRQLAVRLEETATAAGQPPVNVDAAAVADALAGNEAFIDAIGESAASKIADRLQA